MILHMTPPRNQVSVTSVSSDGGKQTRTTKKSAIAKLTETKNMKINNVVMPSHRCMRTSPHPFSCSCLPVFKLMRRSGAGEARNMSFTNGLDYNRFFTSVSVIEQNRKFILFPKFTAEHSYHSINCRRKFWKTRLSYIFGCPVFTTLPHFPAKFSG